MDRRNNPVVGMCMLSECTPAEVDMPGGERRRQGRWSEAGGRAGWNGPGRLRSGMVNQCLRGRARQNIAGARRRREGRSRGEPLEFLSKFPLGALAALYGSNPLSGRSIERTSDAEQRGSGVAFLPRPFRARPVFIDGPDHTAEAVLTRRRVQKVISQTIGIVTVGQAPEGKSGRACTESPRPLSRACGVGGRQGHDGMAEQLRNRHMSTGWPAR